MCTLAWAKADTGFWICFNRDEQRTRPQAEPPRVHPADPVPLVYARDPQGGGTWFAASTAGFAVALLNNYPRIPRDHPEEHQSRGQFVLRVAALPLHELAALSREIDFTNYAPFFLFILSPERVISLEWRGERLEEVVPGDRFWTTSSHLTEAIPAWRRNWWREQFRDTGERPEEMARLMRDTVPDNPAHGLTMDRADARTLSQIELLISGEEIRFTYPARQTGGKAYMAPLVINHRRL